MAKTKVKIHSAGIRDILTSSGVESHLRARMEVAAAAARASAPVASGAYRDSIHVEEVRRQDRVVVRVVADVPHALAVEAGTGNLARALDAAGGD